MKFILIGRTATGKHFLAEKFAEKGFKVIKSYTTDPDTPKGIGYPEVIDPAVAATIPVENKFLMFSEPNTETFILHKDIEDADILILHPNDLPNFVALVPDETLHIIHMTCKDAIAQDAMESANTKHTGKTLKERQIAETPFYSKWEQDLAAKSTFGMSQLITMTVENDFKPETIEGFMLRISYNLALRRNLSDVIAESIALGLIPVNDDGKIRMEYHEPTPHVAGVSTDMFIDILMDNPVDMSYLMMNWMAHSHDVTLGNRKYEEEMTRQAAGSTVDDDPVEPETVNDTTTTV